MHSVEQSQDFHVVRRIAALVAPGWRLFATPSLKPGEFAIDLVKKTIELGEGTDSGELVVNSIFSLGQVRLQRRVRFSLFFGRGLRDWRGTDEQLLNDLANQGALADRYASDWARRMLDAFWPTGLFAPALARCVWRHGDWLQYFSSK